MKKILLFIIAVTIISLAGCGPSSSSMSNSKGNDLDKKGSLRISFDIGNKETVSYKQHVIELWEKTKPLLREDISKNYSDEQLKTFGLEIDVAWVHLQAHTSLNHKDDVEDTKDHKLGNLTGNIIGLADELYNQRNFFNKEEAAKKREVLKNGRLEKKINEFDSILAKVDIK